MAFWYLEFKHERVEKGKRERGGGGGAGDGEAGGGRDGNGRAAHRTSRINQSSESTFDLVKPRKMKGPGEEAARHT